MARLGKSIKEVTSPHKKIAQIRTLLLQLGFPEEVLPTLIPVIERLGMDHPDVMRVLQGAGGPPKALPPPRGGPLALRPEQYAQAPQGGPGVMDMSGRQRPLAQAGGGPMAPGGGAPPPGRGGPGVMHGATPPPGPRGLPAPGAGAIVPSGGGGGPLVPQGPPPVPAGPSPLGKILGTAGRGLGAGAGAAGTGGLLALIFSMAGLPKFVDPEYRRQLKGVRAGRQGTAFDALEGYQQQQDIASGMSRMAKEDPTMFQILQMMMSGEDVFAPKLTPHESFIGPSPTGNPGATSQALQQLLSSGMG